MISIYGRACNDIHIGLFNGTLQEAIDFIKRKAKERGMADPRESYNDGSTGKRKGHYITFKSFSADTLFREDLCEGGDWGGDTPNCFVLVDQSDIPKGEYRKAGEFAD